MKQNTLKFQIGYRECKLGQRKKKTVNQTDCFGQLSFSFSFFSFHLVPILEISSLKLTEAFIQIPSLHRHCFIGKFLFIH